MMHHAKRMLSGCRKHPRRASAVMWFATVRASVPSFAGMPRKQRSRTQRGRKSKTGGPHREAVH